VRYELLTASHERVGVTIMNRHCTNCETPMTQVWLNTGSGTLIIEESKTGLFIKRKSSPVNPFVCPKCGRLELFAEKPEVFE
jgi:ribosomal protein S27AE